VDYQAFLLESKYSTTTGTAIYVNAHFMLNSKHKEVHNPLNISNGLKEAIFGCASSACSHPAPIYEILLFK